MSKVIRMPGTKTPNEFIKELCEKDMDYIVIAFKERGSADVKAAWSKQSNCKLIHAAGFLYESIKRAVFFGGG